MCEKNENRKKPVVNDFTQNIHTKQVATGVVVNSIHHVNTENKHEVQQDDGKKERIMLKWLKCYHVSNETVFLNSSLDCCYFQTTDCRHLAAP